jgi:hypothetical protein
MRDGLAELAELVTVLADIEESASLAKLRPEKPRLPDWIARG